MYIYVSLSILFLDPESLFILLLVDPVDLSMVSVDLVIDRGFRDLSSKHSK